MTDRTASPDRLGFLETIGGLGVGRTRAKLILMLAWPVILGMLTQTAVNLVDTAMVGRLPKEVSIPGQAALGISLPVLWAIGGFLASIQVGTQAIVARRYGEGEKLLAGRALHNSLLVATFTSVLATVGFIYLIPVIFPFFHSDPEVIRWGVPYLQIRLLGLLSMVATAGSKAFFDGIGRTYVHMVAAVVMNVINIFGNWVLIFGNLGAPKLMVTGAAWASTSSTYVGLAIVVGWTLTREIRTGYRAYRPSNTNLTVIWDIVRLSVPSGIATVAMMSGFLLFLKIVGDLDIQLGHGAILSAATKVIIDVMSVTFMSTLAFGTATATLVGQSLGRKKPRRAEIFGWESVKLGVFIFGTLGAVIAIWPDVFLHIFSKDIEVIEAARPSMRLMGSAEFMVAIAMILMQALFGAGNSKFVMWVQLCLHFLCLVPLAYILGVTLELHLLGMWLAGFVYIALLTVIISYKFYEGRWKEIRV